MISAFCAIENLTLWGVKGGILLWNLITNVLITNLTLVWLLSFMNSSPVLFQKSNYKCCTCMVSFLYEQLQCALSNFLFIKFELNDHKSWYPKVCIWMASFLYEQLPCVSSKIEFQMLYLYGFLPLWTAPMCFIKLSHHKIWIEWSQILVILMALFCLTFNYRLNLILKCCTQKRTRTLLFNVEFWKFTAL